MVGANETFVVGGRRVTVYDLSDQLGNATAGFEPNPHAINYVGHAESVSQAKEVFGLGAEYWRDGRAWAIEEVTLTTHSGTHVDAPYHYAPKSGGRPARTIEQVPLRWCFGDGVLIDISGYSRTDGVTGEDLRRELARIGYALKPYDIMLLRTDAWKRFGEPGYQNVHPGLRRSATEWLVDQGVRLIGIDAWTLDRAFDIMTEEAKAGDTDQLWESHYVGAEKEYCQIEKLTHLDQLPAPTGFQVIALPVKLEGASGSWSRVVAVYEEHL